ncbi:MAG: hypothetical protein ACTSSD_19485 [Candidatus Thorarchaeota archaeon]
MNFLIFISATLTWTLLLVAAILNAGLRINVLAVRLSALRAHQVSSIIFMCIVFVTSIVFAYLMSGSVTAIDLWLVGGMWLVFTVTFEFLFGHYVMKHSWQRLFEDYNLLKGRLWSLVLLVILIGPVCGGVLV